jgi:hypothetical protein
MALRKIGFVGLMALATALLAGPAHAVPLLQLYIEGATYNETTETWELARPIDEPLRLWTIGNVAGPGGKGTISNARLAISYDSAFGTTPSFAFASSTTGGLGGFTDPSLAPSATFLGLHTDGSTPVIWGDSSLSPHGVYGDDTYWQEFALGSFSLTDSPIADFITSFPAAPATASGQINVYEITVAGIPVGGWLHFDLYGTYLQGTRIKATFAPYSHDAGNQVHVPEPGTLVLLGSSLLVLGGMAYRRRRAAPRT